MAAARAKLLRKIGIQQKLFTRTQWKKAEADASAQGREPQELLVELGIVGREQLRGLERAVTYRIGRDEDKALAKVIVDSGYATQEAVDRALEEQKDHYSKTGELARLCDVLVSGGALSQSQHLAARKIHEIARASEETASDEKSDPAP